MTTRITVTSDRFERAIARAIDNDFERKLDYRWTHHESGHTEMLFLCDSASNPFREYGTRIFIEDGELTVTCNCDAGQHANHPCWHMAGALMLAGFLPESDGPCEGCGTAVWAGVNGNYDREASMAVCDACQEREAAEIQAEIDAARDAIYEMGVWYGDDDLAPIPF